MVKSTIITKQQVNEYHAYTPNDGLFQSTFFEAVLMDLSGKIATKYITELESQDETVELSDTLKTALDNGLRSALAYYIIGRSIRIGNTLTISRYGVNTKISDYSQLAEQKDIVEASNYMKELGDKYLEKVRDSLVDKDERLTPNDDSYIKATVIGD